MAGAPFCWLYMLASSWAKTSCTWRCCAEMCVLSFQTIDLQCEHLIESQRAKCTGARDVRRKCERARASGRRLTSKLVPDRPTGTSVCARADSLKRASRRRRLDFSFTEPATGSVPPSCPVLSYLWISTSPLVRPLILADTRCRWPPAQRCHCHTHTHTHWLTQEARRRTHSLRNGFKTPFNNYNDNVHYI